MTESNLYTAAEISRLEDQIKQQAAEIERLKNKVNQLTLEKLVRTEPHWAVNVIKTLKAEKYRQATEIERLEKLLFYGEYELQCEIDEREAEIERLKKRLSYFEAITTGAEHKAIDRAIEEEQQ